MAAAVAALVLLRLLVALAPAEPRLLGAPFGLVLELGIMGLATLNLWFAVRTLLPGAEAAGDRDPSGAARTSDQTRP